MELLLPLVFPASRCSQSKLGLPQSQLKDCSLELSKVDGDSPRGNPERELSSSEQSLGATPGDWGPASSKASEPQALLSQHPRVYTAAFRLTL